MNQDVEINIEDIDKIISDIDRPVKRGPEHDGIDSPAKKRTKDANIDPSITNGDLDLQFEMALEQHHREMSGSPAPKAPADKPEDERAGGRSQLASQTDQNNTSDINNLHEAHDQHNKADDNIDPDVAAKAADSEQPQGSDSEQQAQQQRSEHSVEIQPTQSVPTVMHQGVAVPADSELLNSNNAFVAYNELSSQLPSVPMTSNIHLTSLPLPIIAADYLPPRIQLLVNTLPTLDNISTQLLRIFTIGPYQKIIDMVSNPETPQGAAFRDMTSMFEFSKKLYSEDEPFLSVDHIAPGMWKQGEKTPTIFKNREQSIESTLRKVNLSTFLLATLGMIEVGFFYLNESFLNIFCPLNNLDPVNSLSNLNDKNLQSNGINSIIGDKVGKLLKPQAVLYLGLKTQAYISAIEAGERSREEILQDILPDNLEDVLIEKRGTKFLTPTELDFIERCKSRKLILLTYKNNNELSEEYEWFNFLKELFEFVSKNMIFLVWGKKSRLGAIPASGSAVGSSSATAKALLADLNSNIDSANDASDSSNPKVLSGDAPISEISNSYLPSEILEQQLHVKVSNGNNRTTTRRPWTREEEKALRHALELKGPHWSNILELFGAGGKISEALKNRNQGQLKDKARNWKMFFLKAGLPVPQYLQQVTGDLERDDKAKRAKRNAAAPIPKVN